MKREKVVRLWSTGCSLVAILMSFACTDRPKELFETAQFEEIQNNQEHARQLYKEIIRDFPESEFAIRARNRLAALESR